jgi:hypothetical protein
MEEISSITSAYAHYQGQLLSLYARKSSLLFWMGLESTYHFTTDSYNQRKCSGQAAIAHMSISRRSHARWPMTANLTDGF